MMEPQCIFSIEKHKNYLPLALLQWDCSFNRLIIMCFISHTFSVYCHLWFACMHCKCELMSYRYQQFSEVRNYAIFQINVEDFRFDAMYSSHLYNIDPSAPEFKKTKAMESLIEEKQRRRKHPTLKNTSDRTNSSTDFKRKAVNDTEPSENVEKDPKLPGDADRSLSYLVKSVKTKTKLYQQRKK